MTPAPDPALVERFRRDLEALTAAAPTPERKLGVAVSGGADSLALLLLAHAAYPGAIEAATVDHGLRSEAAEEAAWVQHICTAHGVPYEVLRGPAIAPTQQDARVLRYALLGDWAAGRLTWLATAHQQDDVAESLLMRAQRGAGVGGLAAMVRMRALPPSDAFLVRPLLDWSRAELAAVAAAAGLAPIDDPANRSPRYDRSRARALLAATPALSPARLARAAHNLRDAEAALAWAAEREWAVRAQSDGGALTFDMAGLPYELRRRLVLRAIDHIRCESGLRGAIREDGVDRLIAALEAGGVATLGGVRAGAKSGRWRFSLAPARRSH